MMRIQLPRDGRPDLEFDGTMLARVVWRPGNGIRHKLTLFRTSAGKYVLAASAHAQGREISFRCLCFGRLEDVFEFLAEPGNLFRQVRGEMLLLAGASARAMDRLAESTSRCSPG